MGMFLKGILTLFLYLLNLLTHLLVLFIAPFLKDKIPSSWIRTSRCIHKYVSGISIEAQLPEGLNLDTFYLVSANHQCWSDILVLFDTFDQKIPMLKFFMKKQLLWVPLVGLACWLYDYPRLHRHTKTQLQKHPEWKNKDFEATKKACEKFKSHPGSLMFFPEGTRFTSQKHKKQASPFQYLLKPKAGCMAFALQCMEGRVKTFVDVTLLYPSQKPRFWDYCCGKIKKVIVHARVIPIPETLLTGDYENDLNYRARFQQFLNTLWHEKDKRIGDFYAKNAQSSL
jgi:1-acyl-sn-glycerol-3-phosphate acyltransferase